MGKTPRRGCFLEVFQSPSHRGGYFNAVIFRPTRAANLGFSPLLIGAGTSIAQPDHQRVHLSLFQSPSHRGGYFNFFSMVPSGTSPLVSVPFSSGRVLQLFAHHAARHLVEVSVPFSSGRVLQFGTSRSGTGMMLSFSPLLIGAGTSIPLPSRGKSRSPSFQSPSHRGGYFNLCVIRELNPEPLVSVPFSSGRVLQ